MTPQERAQKAAQAMWANDEASKWVGMTLGPVGVGHAVMTLEIAKHHCNGHGNCHGGVIFSLADSCFAFACNSRNQATVAQHNMISFVAPAKQGDLLTATATETGLTGRNGIYDVRVVAQDGRIIAEMRGLSRAVSGNLFDEKDESRGA